MVMRSRLNEDSGEDALGDNGAVVNKIVRKITRNRDLYFLLILYSWSNFKRFPRFAVNDYFEASF